MPRAQVTPASYYVTCRCGESVPEPSTGSFVWESHQLRGAHVCPSCNRSVSIAPRKESR